MLCGLEETGEILVTYEYASYSFSLYLLDDPPNPMPGPIVHILLYRTGRFRDIHNHVFAYSMTLYPVLCHTRRAIKDKRGLCSLIRPQLHLLWVCFWRLFSCYISSLARKHQHISAVLPYCPYVHLQPLS